MKKILIIAGPSAVGKTTVAHELIKRGNIPFELVRSATTRSPRGDSYDEEYIYLSRDEFLSLIERGGVLEHTEYAGELYGTPLSEIERITESGKFPLLILDLAGVRSICDNPSDVSACALYIYDDISVMDERLLARYDAGEKKDSDFARLTTRKAQNRSDYASIEKYSVHFYAFVENSREISDTVASVEKCFEDFLSNIPRDASSAEQVAASLVKMSSE